MNDLTARISKRLQTAHETAESAKSMRAENEPTLEDIAQFHELHARHERELGHEAQACAAEERARHARVMLAKRVQARDAGDDEAESTDAAA